MLFRTNRREKLNLAVGVKSTSAPDLLAWQPIEGSDEDRPILVDHSHAAVLHLPHNLLRALGRDALADALAGPRVIEIVDIFVDMPIQMAVIQDQQVVETFSFHAADEELADGIGLRSPDWWSAATRLKQVPY